MQHMGELIRIRNEILATQNYYNQKVTYDKLRYIVASRIPPGSMNKVLKNKIAKSI